MHDLKNEKIEVSFKENLKDASYTFLLILTLFIGIQVLDNYFSLFPPAISVSLELEILKTIVQADGFLIGLSGVVFAQMFWAINHQQNTIQVDILQHPQILPDYLDTGDIREHYVPVLDKKRRDMTLKMFVVVGLFMVSIALSVSTMAKTEIYETKLASTFPDISSPFLSMILGVVFLVFSIATSKMSLKD